MNMVGKYCKAYPLKRFREFDGWIEKAKNLNIDTQPAPGLEDYLYLQADYCVTIDLSQKKLIVFDAITPEWIAFCQEILQFKVPKFASRGLKTTSGSIPALSAEQEVVTGFVPLTPPQTWFFRTFTLTPERFALTIAAEVDQPFDSALLKQTIEHLFIHHDSLRAHFIPSEQGWQQRVVSPDEVGEFLSTHDFSALSAEDARQAAINIALEQQNSCDISKTPLMKAAYVNMGAQAPAQIFIRTHHLVMDGFSMNIILTDIQSIYAQLLMGQPVTLPTKTTAYKTYANNIRQYARSIAKQELEYWLNLPWHQVKPLPMDMPENRAQDTYGNIQYARVELGSASTNELLAAIQTQASGQIQIADFLLTAIALTFKQWKEIDTVWITSGNSGRSAPLETLDLSRTVGWIGTTNHYLLDVSHVNDPVAALKTVAQQKNAVPMAGLGYELLTFLVDDEETAEIVKPILAVPKTHALFNYMGNIFSSIQNQESILRTSTLPIQALAMQQWQDQRFHPIEIDGQIGEDGLVLRFIYGSAVFHAETMELLAKLCRENLLALIQDTKNQKIS